MKTNNRILTNYNQTSEIIERTFQPWASFLWLLCEVSTNRLKKTDILGQKQKVKHLPQIVFTSWFLNYADTKYDKNVLELLAAVMRIETDLSSHIRWRSNI